MMRGIFFYWLGTSRRSDRPLSLCHVSLPDAEPPDRCVRGIAPRGAYGLPCERLEKIPDASREFVAEAHFHAAFTPARSREEGPSLSFCLSPTMSLVVRCCVFGRPCLRCFLRLARASQSLFCTSLSVLRVRSSCRTGGAGGGRGRVCRAMRRVGRSAAWSLSIKGIQPSSSAPIAQITSLTHLSVPYLWGLSAGCRGGREPQPARSRP